MVLQITDGDGAESSSTGDHSANVNDSDEKRCKVDRSEPATRAAPAVTLFERYNDNRSSVYDSIKCKRYPELLSTTTARNLNDTTTKTRNK